MTAAARALTATLIIALLMPLVSCFVPMMLPDVSQAPVLVYCASMAQELLLFGLPALLLGCRGKRGVSVGAKLGWMAAGILCACLAVPALQAASGWWREVSDVPNRYLPQTRGAGERLLQLIALAVVPAIAEEAFFRGALLGALRKSCHPVTAVLLSAGAFALMHGSLGGLLSHLAIGLILSLLMWHSGSLLVPVTAHLAYNLLIVLGMQYPVWLPLAGGAVLVLGAGFLMAVLRGSDARLSRKEMWLAAAALIVMAARYFI